MYSYILSPGGICWPSFLRPSVPNQRTFLPKPDAGLLAVDGAEGALSPDLALRHEARSRCTDSGADDDRA